MMVDPVGVIDALVRTAVREVLHRELEPQVHRSTRCDVQADLVVALARTMGAQPAELAGRIVAAIPANDAIESTSIAPAGFINFTLRAEWLARAVGRIAADPRLAVPRAEQRERVVIDYSSPNIAKELHVGHLRSTVIGDCLARVLEFRGHTVIRQNHLGDWGLPFGVLIEQLVDAGIDPTVEELGMGRLTAMYQTGRTRDRDEPAFAERARRRVVALQGGDPDTLARWRALVDQSARYMADVYQRLGVTLTPADVRPESSFNDRLEPLASSLEAAGHARITEGALGIFPEGFTNRDGNPLPLIVRNRDGGYGYATTDLAALRYRIEELGATRLIYVVGAQAQHFAMVFAVARGLGWLVPPARAQNVGFGIVLDKNGKRLATRDGSPPRLVELIADAIAAADRAVDQLETKRRDYALESGKPFVPLSADARAEVARMAGIGSIKYADLSADRNKDYIFDLSRMVRFEGNTAGYAQYVYARVRSLFARAGAATPGPIRIEQPAERALALALTAFGATIAAVEDKLEPHHLVGEVFRIATAFTAFYEKCPILDAPDETRASRLALADVTARTIRCGLDLLGIETPERM